MFVSPRPPTSLIRANPVFFSFGDIWDEAEAEGLGNVVASPHPSTRGAGGAHTHLATSLSSVNMVVVEGL